MLLRGILNITTGRGVRAWGAGAAILALHVVAAVVAARVLRELTS